MIGHWKVLLVVGFGTLTRGPDRATRFGLDPRRLFIALMRLEKSSSPGGRVNHAMHVIGKHDPGIEMDGRSDRVHFTASCNGSICRTNKSARRSNRLIGEKVSASRHTVTAVIRHR
jgi:hypothetical protein